MKKELMIWASDTVCVWGNNITKSSYDDDMLTVWWEHHPIASIDLRVNKLKFHHIVSTGTISYKIVPR